MENLQDMLLEHMVPDQVGQVGKVEYSFTEMKIVHVHWPKVSNVDGLFVANNGALRLQGNYLLHRPGVKCSVIHRRRDVPLLLTAIVVFSVILPGAYGRTGAPAAPCWFIQENTRQLTLGYNKTGEFVFDLGAICLTIKDNSSDTQAQRQRNNHHRNNQHSNVVTCTVGHIKVKFHGGAAKVCQFLTSLYIKVYRRHLEAQIAKVIQETVQEDGQILLSALSVMASMHSEDEPRNQTTSQSQNTLPPAQNSPEREVGKVQRFLDRFTHNPPQT